MERVTLGNRPATLPPRCKIEDFLHDGKYVRVSLKLREGTVENHFILDAQAFEVDANGLNVVGPDGRPSRTSNSGHTIETTSIGDTHTLNPGWVRIVGDYDANTFEPTAVRGTGGKPTEEPEISTNPTRQFYDTDSGIGYRWDDEGESLRICKSKVLEMCNIIRNSAPLAGIDF